MAKKEKLPGFEQLYTELEATIEKLEEGNLSLDESLALYERGVELAKQCTALLDRAQLRIQELAPDAAQDLESFGNGADLDMDSAEELADEDE